MKIVTKESSSLLTLAYVKKREYNELLTTAMTAVYMRLKTKRELYNAAVTIIMSIHAVIYMLHYYSYIILIN